MDLFDILLAAIPFMSCLPLLGMTVSGSPVDGFTGLPATEPEGDNAPLDQDTDGGDSTPIEQEPEAHAQPEPPEPEQQEEDWFNEDQKAIAESYGFSEQEVRQFGSAEEFAKHRMFYDRQLLSRQQAHVQSEPESPASERTFEQKTEQPARDPSFKFDFEMDPDVYVDDAERARMVGMRDHYENLLGAQVDHERAVAEMRHFQETKSRFDDIVDSLGDSELFGDLSKAPLTQEQFDNRSKLWDTGDYLTRDSGQSLASRGIVLRSRDMAFAEHQQKRAAEAAGEAARTRSTQRKGSPGRPKSDVSTDMEYEGPLENHPALMAKWAELNG